MSTADVSARPNSRLRVPLILATVAVCALFLAQAATRIMAASLLANSEAEEPARAASELKSLVEPRRYDPKPVLKRNIFDSVQGDLTRLAEPELGAEDLASAWDGRSALPRCEGGDLRLVGAVASSSDWAIAAIVGSTGQTSFHRRGSQLDGVTVLGIGSDSVVVQPSEGAACRLEMFSYSAASSKPRVASAPKPKKPAPKKESVRGPRVKRDRNAGLSKEEIAQGIQRVTDSSFVIKKKILDKVLDNPGKLMDIARIRPHQEGGKTVGMKLARIHPNTLLTKLGLKNGDILIGIDGEDLSSPDTALKAYASLRTAESLSLTVRRKGSPMTIRYTLQ